MKVEDWIKKGEQLKQKGFDISRDEDLSLALMNLVSLEEHFYFTAMKTNDGKYLDMLKAVRELRKKLLKKIVKNPQGEEWCISKHLLASSMRLIEVGTKELSKNGSKKAEPYFKSAFELHSLFFAINLGMVDSKKMSLSSKDKKNGKMMQKFSGIMKKMIDCCKEW